MLTTKHILKVGQANMDPECSLAEVTVIEKDVVGLGHLEARK